MKYIVVTGGVISGIGKGITASSIGALLKACDVPVTAIKIDPYINIDAGTFSPFEHGEVFVLNDGTEVDLDLGNYERFLDTDLQGSNNITTGQIFQEVTLKERQGAYLGQTVQIIPHITDAIQERIEAAAMIKQEGKQPQVCIIEVGGTIGDMESTHFIEALRRLRRFKADKFCSCHVSMVPCVGSSMELKSKPTQHSVIQLQSLGIDPDMIVCRSEMSINETIRMKISESCNVKPESVFSLPDLDTIYRVPIELKDQGMIETLASCLELTNLCPGDRLEKWSKITRVAIHAEVEIIIALVGKYTALGDCYTSVVKSLEHACYEIGARPNLRLIDSDKLLESAGGEAWRALETSHCLVVPGGFGVRGVEGKIAAIKWARESKFPFLGICLGFQMAAVEYARNVLGISNAHSAEFIPELADSIEPIVIEMLEYRDPDQKMGGTMRLGLRKTVFQKHKSILRQLYGQGVIEERHRHRYEINPLHIEALEKAGLLFVGKSEDSSRMEILELDQSVHPYFVGVQFHPEYKSRLFKPSPPYKGLIDAGKRVYLSTKAQ